MYIILMLLRNKILMSHMVETIKHFLIVKKAKIKMNTKFQIVYTKLKSFRSTYNTINNLVQTKVIGPCNSP